MITFPFRNSFGFPNPWFLSSLSFCISERDYDHGNFNIYFQLKKILFNTIIYYIQSFQNYLSLIYRHFAPIVFFLITLLPHPIYFTNEIDGLDTVPREIIIAYHFVSYLSIIHSLTACK